MKLERRPASRSLPKNFYRCELNEMLYVKCTTFVAVMGTATSMSSRDKGSHMNSVFANGNVYFISVQNLLD